jgi:2,5-diamino-6-(ribosylamino)-4(3H)-pyrimidinone 5'-phosphate reductase
MSVSNAHHSRPFVVVNVAMSADGKLSTKERRQVKISGASDFSRVDELKAGCDGIMVGIGTVLADDPSLTVKSEELIERRVRAGFSPHPVRIIVDSLARTPLDAAILHKGYGRRIIGVSNAADPSLVRQLLMLPNVSVFVCGEKRVDLLAFCAYLRKCGIERLMVEGGGTLIMGLFEAGLVDEVHAFIGNIIIGGHDAPTLADGDGFALEDDFIRLVLHSVTPAEDGVLLSWYVKNGSFANRDRY